METIVLQKKISSHPRDFNDKLIDNIYEKLKSNYVGKCKQRYGYIVSIEPSIEINENKITEDGYIMFTVNVNTKVFKPKVGDVLEGVVCMILEDGLFVQIVKNMNVLIPKDTLDLTYNKSDDTFGDDENVISKGDKINIKIGQIKYDKTGFIIIGSLAT